MISFMGILSLARGELPQKTLLLKTDFLGVNKAFFVLGPAFKKACQPKVSI
jgi:hypothetical protein